MRWATKKPARFAKLQSLPQSASLQSDTSKNSMKGRGLKRALRVSLSFGVDKFEVDVQFRPLAFSDCALKPKYTTQIYNFSTLIVKKMNLMTISIEFIVRTVF